MVERVQLKINFVPKWEDPYKSWAAAYVHKNAWRVVNLFDEEECLQECGALVFARCCQYYVGKVEGLNPKWFMSLFKRAVANEIHTWSVKSKEKREGLANYAIEVRSKVEDIEYAPTILQAAIAEASDELKTVIAAIGTAPTEFLELLLEEANDKTWSRRLCRLCGIAINENIISELRSLLA